MDNFLETCIVDENDSLRSVVLYGNAGSEIVLDQLYPQQMSLFCKPTNVIQLRKEVGNFMTILKQHRVDITQIRNKIVQVLQLTDKFDCKSFDVKTALIHKAEFLHKSYGGRKILSYYTNQIDALFDEDVKEFGLKESRTLNFFLSLSGSLPLSGLIYARDQMSVVGNKLIIANMGDYLRKPETLVYSHIYEQLYSSHQTISIPSKESFEGGDLYIHNGVVYLGVGARTTYGAATYIYSNLYEGIQQNGFEFAIIVDSEIDNRSFMEKLNFMHLDTWSCPIGRNQMLLFPPEAKRRKVFIIRGKGRDLQVIDTGKSFYEFLLQKNDKIYEISEEEQQNFCCNNLALDENTMVVSTKVNIGTNSILHKLGKNIVHTSINEILKGYGGIHCMTGQLRRG